MESPLITYYAERASEYERIYQRPERQADLKRLQALVQDALRGADVLEVACGTGYWTQIIASTAASVLATDITEEVLALARLKSMDPDRVTFQKQDACALRAPSRRFNAGMSAFWWSHVRRCEIPVFLAGFHRVLVPGARVLFIDNVFVEGRSTPVSRTDEYGDTYQLRKLSTGSVHEVRKNFPTEQELRTAVRGVASDVRVEVLEYYWFLSYALC